MEQSQWRDLVSGKLRGAGPSLMRCGLSLASVGYRLATFGRDWAYRSGLRRPEQVGLPVVSIGNLTAGGTGKTPFCAWIARWFRQAGVRVCLISRGYGSVDGQPNDEALVLKQLCPDVPHLQGPHRARLARIAKQELCSQLILLDDGFQHRQLARDLDIVLIDATCPWGFGKLLPRGLLREPPTALRRANLVALTRCDQVAARPREEILAEVRRFARDKPVIQTHFLPQRLVNGSANEQPIDLLKGRRVAAFCGLGNPDAFRQTLVACGADVIGFRPLPDHHPFTRRDIEDLRQWAGESTAELVVTSQKDLVKLGLDHLGQTPLWAIVIDLHIPHDLALLEAELRKVCPQ